MVKFFNVWLIKLISFLVIGLKIIDIKVRNGYDVFKFVLGILVGIIMNWFKIIKIVELILIVIIVLMDIFFFILFFYFIILLIYSCFFFDFIK